MSARGHGQSGPSLLEVLLTLAVAVLLIGPLGMWLTLALRQQPAVQAGLIGTSAEGILAIEFPKDVVAAAAAAVDALTRSYARTIATAAPESQR